MPWWFNFLIFSTNFLAHSVPVVYNSSGQAAEPGGPIDLAAGWLPAGEDLPIFLRPPNPFRCGASTKGFAMFVKENAPDVHVHAEIEDSLALDRKDINFEDLTEDIVRISVRIHNRGWRRSAPTTVRLESAPLGAFVHWQSLAVLPLPPIEPGESRVVTVDVARPGPLPPAKSAVAVAAAAGAPDKFGGQKDLDFKALAIIASSTKSRPELRLEALRRMRERFRQRAAIPPAPDAIGQPDPRPIDKSDLAALMALFQKRPMVVPPPVAPGTPVPANPPAPVAAPADLPAWKAELAQRLLARRALARGRPMLAWAPWDAEPRQFDRWVGNINVFLGNRPAVERHMANGVRIYPGMVNMALFEVGGGTGAGCLYASTERFGDRLECGVAPRTGRHGVDSAPAGGDHGTRKVV